MVKVPKGYRSRNVNDRRGSSGGGGRGFGFPSRRGSSGGSLGGGLGGGGLGGNMGGGGLGGALGGAGAATGRRRGGCGGMGLIVVLVLLALLFFACQGGGGNSGNTGGTSTGSSGSSSSFDPIDESSDEFANEVDLVNFVLDDVQDNFWVDEYPSIFGQPYRAAQLDLFTGRTSTGGCGTASSNVGPFYCPADSKAYIDLAFMLQLQRQLGAGGDFAQAYILAHEIGHHVQNLAGINDAMRRAQSGVSRAQSNELQVMLELQADCFAGAWAADADARGGIIEEGDLEEGVRAAGAVGDDAITGSSNQENFTHGSSAQRIEWFSRGFDLGASSCDTFNGALG